MIIDIDDRSLREAGEVYGRWPWPRSAHAAMLDFVALGRPRAVGVDVLFAEPDPARPEGDGALAASTARAGAPVVHSVVFQRPLQGAARAPERTASGLEPFALELSAPPGLAPAYADAATPFPALLAAAGGVGVIDRTPDSDGVERLEPLLFRHGGRIYPALAPALALGGRQGYPRLAERGGQLFLDGRKVPLEGGRLRAHWRGGYADRPFPVIAAHAVLRSYYEIATGGEPPLDPAVFAGRTVLIGSSAIGVGDVFASPFGPTEPGVLLHASLLDTLARRDFLRAPSAPLAALVTALIALLAGLVIAAGRSVRGAAVRLLALLAGWTAVALAAFFARGAILPWAGPVLGAIVAYGAAGAGSWLTEGRRHRETKRAFGKFVPPGVVETIAADPRLRHRVERREITVLFADVRGFTSIAEREGAERTVETLNELFSAMVDAVFRHGGTLDKFLGDGLLAFFGAPLPQPDHAARACRAAIEMLDRLERLNAQWTASARPTLAMGIGIHSGPAVVGFVGDPERRLDYTAIGDTVNLASRLQVQTKELHERIIVSAATARQAGDAFPFRDLGETRVRGRAEPVTVLALEAGGAPS